MAGKLWNFPCAFAQAELVRALFGLFDNKLYLPGKGEKTLEGLALTKLANLGALGFDRGDIHDGLSR